MMEEFYSYFGELSALTPELFIKYIIFITALAGFCRLIGELFDAVK